MTTITRTIDDDWRQRATLSVEDTAAVLGLSRNTVYSAIRSGEIPCVRVGRRFLVPTALLAEMLGLVSDRSPAASDSHVTPDVQRSDRTLPL